MKRLLPVIFILSSIFICACTKAEYKEEDDLHISQLAEIFDEPATIYRPYVWWHWLGPNFSKEGITKDLEAMKEAGIGGATIFNITSSVMESENPMKNNPWPEQTYRSEAYWEAVKHAAAEAERLGMKIGIHNSPGYATTGGPWIDDEKAMKVVVSSEVKVKGGRKVEIKLEIPELPTFSNWQEPVMKATSYWDIEVMAVPQMKETDPDKVLCITEFMDKKGNLTWDAPEGEWTICRIGYAPTMSMPHPLPDELSGKAFEVDKFSREHNIYHWDQVLEPIKEHLGEYIGKSVDHILIDSYEAGYQNWTETYRDEFKTRKGYDPLPWIALERTYGDEMDIDQYKQDNADVINDLYIQVGWATAREKINEAGLKFYIEPYDYLNQFDVYESASMADVPMVEFWHNGDGWINSDVVRAAKDTGKKIVAVEAFTGWPTVSMYVEDPALLKHSADGALHNGVNRFFLHHWVHQPFDDRYQPGMGMGWWGSHFSRHQTWIKPGRAFFYYLARCQMLLQQGQLVDIYDNITHRRLTDGDIFFVNNLSGEKFCQRITFKAASDTPQLWDADKGTIRSISSFETDGTSTTVEVSLNPDESIFVVFPDRCDYNKTVLPDYKVVTETATEITGDWDVTFEPKLAERFTRTYQVLKDFSEDEDPNVKYFAGTATYRKEVEIEDSAIKDGHRIILDLGEMNDIAEISVNGKSAGVAWYPPYVIDITDVAKAGKNTIAIAVSNNWANRLIGDEQHPADFEWGEDRGIDKGRAMKSFPDWFINNTPRPSEGRKTFNLWYYYRKDSPLNPAGLVGPVRIIEQEVI